MLTFCLLASLAPAPLPASCAGDAKTVAVKAGTVMLVAEGKVLTGGATVLLRDHKIAAVGKEVAIPADAQVVDYGPDAVITPGFVDANSSYAFGPGSPRTAAPGVRAIDNVDFYSNLYVVDLMGGVTTAYVPPAHGRLIAGQSAVIKLAGADERARVLSDRASLSGAISDEARATPGYWEIPVPATAQTGLGFEQPQLPHSLMGAIVALDELLDAARGGKDESYGQSTPRELAELLQKNVPWRIDADSPSEVRSISEWAKKARLPLIVEGAGGAGPLAEELAENGVSVVVEIPISPSPVGRDLGKDEDEAWPRYDTASKLIAGGVRTAIATPDNVRPRELRYAASIAQRGGLSDEAALRAITLDAASILGVDQRVGSIEVGKDADLVVLNGPPTSITSSVVATYVDGDIAWRASGGSSSLVVEADELYLGDGKYARPGQVLVRDGRIIEVGERVGHPLGATIVRGKAAMPGMIDSFGFLGLEGSSRVPAPDFKLSRLIAAPDSVDKRVAEAGVTTIALAPRGPSNAGAPIMAYKPAGTKTERKVIEDPCAIHLTWSQPGNRAESGKAAKQLLDKAVEYDKKWRAYDEALAKWTPPKETPSADEPKKEEGAKDGEKKDEKASDSSEKKDDAKKDDDKSKKDKKKGEVEPLDGVWKTKVTVSPFAEQHEFDLRLERHDNQLNGHLRCDGISPLLVLLTGTYTEVEKEAEKSEKSDKGEKSEKDKSKDSKEAKDSKDKEKRHLISLSGWSTRGHLTIEAELKDAKLEGKLVVGNTTVEFKAEHASKELEVASRPERRRAKGDEAEVKGKPKPPGVDEKLEPMRKALHGEVAVLVDVDREDEIVDCVNVFQAAGVKPVLFGASEIWRVADQVKGKIGGVLVSQGVLRVDPKQGLQSQVNRYAELADQGIRVAFHSDSDEGAADLPVIALYAVSLGLSPGAALRALTSDAADLLGIDKHVGRLAPGLDGDILVLDGEPLDPKTSVLRAFVNGEEIR